MAGQLRRLHRCFNQYQHVILRRSNRLCVLQYTGIIEQRTDLGGIVGDTATETATETTTTTSESSTSESVGESSTDIEISSFTTFPSSTSEPEEPESPTNGETKGSDGPSGGVIAGAVVGSIAGVALIVGVVILAFRMGRRSRDDGERPGGGIRDSLRSVPMPTRAFQEPEPKPPVPVIQPVFVQDSQPYHNNSEK